MKAKKRIRNALEIANKYAGCGGDHHRMWVIDQMVRALTDCPIIQKSGISYQGEPYTFESMGESQEYLDWVKNYQTGVDGPVTYSWDTGVAP